MSEPKKFSPGQRVRDKFMVARPGDPATIGEGVVRQQTGYIVLVNFDHPDFRDRLIRKIHCDLLEAL